MKSTYVLSTADSRLHADIMMIRLRRAGINIDQVSAVFSHRFVPNSFFFWLRRPRHLAPRTDGESFFAAGPLRQAFSAEDNLPTIRRKLRHLGLDGQSADHFALALSQGHAVLCVKAKNEDEAAVAWHIFKHSKAESIAVSGHPAPHLLETADLPVAPAWTPAVAA